MPNQNNLESLDTNITNTPDITNTPEETLTPSDDSSLSKIETLGPSEDLLANPDSVNATAEQNTNEAPYNLVNFNNAQDLINATGSIATTEIKNLDSLKKLAESNPDLITANNETLTETETLIEDVKDSVNNESATPSETLPKPEVLSDEFGNELLEPGNTISSISNQPDIQDILKNETATILSTDGKNLIVKQIFTDENKTPFIAVERIVEGLNKRTPLKTNSYEAIYHYDFDFSSLAIPISKVSNLIFVMDDNAENKAKIIEIINTQTTSPSNESTPIIPAETPPEIVLPKIVSKDNETTNTKDSTPDYDKMTKEVYSILIEKYQVSGALVRLHNYLETTNAKSITRYKNAREKIEQIPITNITEFLNQKEKYRKNIQEVIDTMDVKYGTGIGLANLSKYLETGKTALITSTNDARKKISKIPKAEIEEFINSKAENSPSEA